MTIITPIPLSIDRDNGGIVPPYLRNPPITIQPVYPFAYLPDEPDALTSEEASDLIKRMGEF